MNVRLDWIRRCPELSLAADHYRRDGTCRCFAPERSDDEECCWAGTGCCKPEGPGHHAAPGAKEGSS